MTHLHPALSYQFDALEPHIDAQTMQFHYYKHHQSAVETLNKAIAGTEAENKTLEEILLNVSAYPYARNSAGSHYNHSQYWKILGPAGTQPSGEFLTAINNTFGSLDAMKKKVNAAGLARFGSGWAWLIVKDGKLEVTSTPNQDNPLMNTAEVQGTPLIGIDVWEHAYYLKYQNRRADYLTNIWNVINWDEVGNRFNSIKNNSLRIMRIPKQVLLFILFTLGMMKAMGQDSPPPMAMPIQNQKILVDKIIEVTKHQQYFTDYCTKKVSEFAEKENWSKRKTREILHSIRFEDYNSTIYNSYAFYSTEQLTKLLEVLVELNKTTKSWDTFILTNEMMQSNLDLHVKSILEGKYILNK